MGEPINWFVIVNPTSGRGLAKKRWPKIKKELIAEGLTFTGHESAYSGHSIELARDAVGRGFRKFICVGGDGTLHELVNGLMRQQDVSPREFTVGLIPIGTGNDWARQFNIPKNIDKAITKLKAGNTQALDIGRITLDSSPDEPVYFNNLAGAGFDGHIIKTINRFKSLGAMAYLMGAINGLFNYKKFEARIKWEGNEVRSRCLMVIAGLGKYAGGGMRLTNVPDASDGFFDLSIAGDIGRFQVLRLFPSLFNGKITRSPYVQTDKINEMRVEVSGEIQPLIEADGELIGSGSFEVGIVPKAIKFIT